MASFASPEAAVKAPNHRLARTLFDGAASAIGLFALSPVLAIAALAVAFEDGSPVLFRQQRVGLGGKPFQLLKFRSMRTGSPGRRITAHGDPRLTRAGRVLRKYKIDELPQLWNVLKGEMSLVGPRPEVPSFVNLDDLVWQAVLQVKPGVTDLASLVYRNEEEILAAAGNPEIYYKEVVLPEKLQLNLQYLRSRTFWRDLRLILLTVRYSFFPSGFDSARVLDAFRVTVTPGPATEAAAKAVT